MFPVKSYCKITYISQGKVCGLCGNFDNNANDDFTTRGQSLETHTQAFGNSWKVTTSCSDRNKTDLCASQPAKFAMGQKRCSIIKSDLFRPCHSKVSFPVFSPHSLLLCVTLTLFLWWHPENAMSYTASLVDCTAFLSKSPILNWTVPVGAAVPKWWPLHPTGTRHPLEVPLGKGTFVIVIPWGKPHQPQRGSSAHHQHA